ncbi:MAG: hypothetical protein J7K53_07605, partial [Bacteroidales bacterium]|nr:hypothetical protein [Bacteroidales bacterium]
YFMLLKMGGLNATDISKLSKVPRTKIYSVLENLEKKGFCIRIPGNFKKYKALSPKVAFSNFVYEIEEKRNNITHLVGSLETFYETEKRGMDSLDNYIEILTNNNQIHERYVSLVRNTKHEFIGFAKPPYAHERNKQKLNTQENVEFEILRKGVIEKVLYECPPEKDMEFTINHIEKCVKAGEKARMIEKIPVKMYISDARYVLMALDNPEISTSPFTMILIEHPDLALANKILFEHLWEKAMPFEEFKIKGV